MDKLRLFLFAIGLLGVVLTVANFSFCRWDVLSQLNGLAWCGGWPDFSSWNTEETYLDYFPPDYFSSETSLLTGTYVVYSVSQSEEDWNTETSEWVTTNKKTLYRYRIEDGEKEILKTLDDPTVEYYNNGFYFTLFDGQVWKKISLDGKESDDQNQFTYSNNGKFFMASQALDLGSGETSVAHDGLVVKIFDENNNLIAAPEVIWKDVGCNMAEADIWFVSDDGQRIYVYGRTEGSSKTNVFWQYSLATNKWQEVAKLKAGSEESSWFSWFDFKTELVTVFDNNQDGTSRAYGIDLADGDEYDLWTGEFDQIQWAAWSPANKTVLLASEDECLFEVSIGKNLTKSLEDCDFKGALLDLIDNFLIIDQDGKLKLVDMKTRESMVLSEKEFTAPDVSSQSYEYLGVVKVE